MTTLFITDPRFADHEVPAGHPERPARLDAVLRGVENFTERDQLTMIAPRMATVDEMARVHDRRYLTQLEAFCTAGGGRLDPDTMVVPASWDAARLSAGAGLDAVDRLRNGEADAAFLAVRPPGHHATPTKAMGFCLVNSVAVTAAALAAGGERVLIVDIDAHHGNGTQDAFWSDGRVAYVSIHESPMYPYTGAIDDMGSGEGVGTTCNLPVAAGAGGDLYRQAIDDVIAPFAARFEPTWILLSVGFDAHRADPLTDLGLTAGDYHDLVGRLVALCPTNPPVVFLEGGYDLDAVVSSTTATLAALAGVAIDTEPRTGAQVPTTVIDRVRRVHNLDEV